MAVTIPYRGSKGPLNLPIDSTGIKAEGEGEWDTRKHGGAKRRLWRKIHIGVDQQTLEIRAIEITSSRVGDAPMLPELLSQIPADVEIGSVTADGACDTRKCHGAVAGRGAHAIKPPRKNAKPWKPTTAGAIARNEAVPSGVNGADTTAGAAPRHEPDEEKVRGTFSPGDWIHCVKLLAQSLMARDFDRQVAELQNRAAVLNRYTALGIPVTEPMGQVRLGKGKCGLRAICSQNTHLAQNSSHKLANPHAAGPGRRVSMASSDLPSL